MENFILGIAVDLSPNGSIHTKNFMNVLKLVVSETDAILNNKVIFILVNDEAKAISGKIAAETLIKAGARCVLGHFASASAAAACSLYQRANIPLLLPGASADHLTTDYKIAFRLCGNDKSLSKSLLKYITSQTDYRKLFICHDNSYHGSALTKSILSILFLYKHIYQVLEQDECDAIIFTGTFESSLEFVIKQRQAGFDKPIFLTDDAVHSSLSKLKPEYSHDIFACGFCPFEWVSNVEDIVEKYFHKFGEKPSTYFLETYAAFEIAYKMATYSKVSHNLTELLNCKTWSTILGDIKFHEREHSHIQQAIWSVKNGNLFPITAL